MMKTKTLVASTLVAILFAGHLAAQNHTTGAPNSLISLTTGVSNTACGAGTLQFTTTGNNNAALGTNALRNNVSGGQNTALGSGAMSSNTTGNFNIGVGNNALAFNTSGQMNYAFGNRCMETNSTGGNNVGMGFRALGGAAFNGSNNTAVGNSSFVSNTSGGWNSGFGTNSGLQVTTGQLNTCIGFESGTNLTTGNSNTFLGRVSISPSATTLTTIGTDGSGNVILADGQSNQRLIIYGGDAGTNARAGFAGIGLTNNSIPNNRLEVRHGTNGNSGLRFTNMTNLNTTPITNPDVDRGVLSVNANGDVILVTDQLGTGGGVTGVNACGTQYNVPTTGSNTNGNLTCGMTYDNGSTVSIGTALTNASPVAYNSSGYATLGVGSVPTTGDLTLDVNGIVRAVAYFATSDKRFKKDIRPIENGLDIVNSLEGKIYNWDKSATPSIRFDDASHSGVIAQDIEKVLPHLVATDVNGLKSVNYIEIIPYLIEAVKEQQTQINDLKAQLSDSFKANNAELINLSNTKIISVSPNPSKDVITVSFNVEKSVMSAKLLVHDLNGNALSSLNVNDRDNNITRTLQKDNFGAGVYIISLVVNGKSIDTKKIVFN